MLMPPSLASCSGLQLNGLWMVTKEFGWAILTTESCFKQSWSNWTAMSRLWGELSTGGTATTATGSWRPTREGSMALVLAARETETRKSEWSCRPWMTSCHRREEKMPDGATSLSCWCSRWRWKTLQLLLATPNDISMMLIVTHHLIHSQYTFYTLIKQWFMRLQYQYIA